MRHGIKLFNAVPPCKGCTERHEGCHDTCERFKVYKKQVNKENRMRKEKTIIESYGIVSKRK